MCKYQWFNRKISVKVHLPPYAKCSIISQYHTSVISITNSQIWSGVHKIWFHTRGGGGGGGVVNTAFLILYPPRWGIRRACFSNHFAGVAIFCDFFEEHTECYHDIILCASIATFKRTTQRNFFLRSLALFVALGAIDSIKCIYNSVFHQIVVIGSFR